MLQAPPSTRLPSSGPAYPDCSASFREPMGSSRPPAPAANHRRKVLGPRRSPRQNQITFLRSMVRLGTREKLGWIFVGLPSGQEETRPRGPERLLTSSSCLADMDNDAPSLRLKRGSLTRVHNKSSPGEEGSLPPTRLFPMGVIG